MFIKKSEIFFIFSSFLVWRVSILVFVGLAVKFLPLFSHNYLGGGFFNYDQNPVFWGHLNFDGEHYLSIAQNGYSSLQHFFFPFFPYLISIFTSTKSVINLAWTGLIISNLSFLICLIGIYKLVALDYKDHIAKQVIILFLVFPTSFFFGIYYTESLFLSLIVWSFYFARKNNFLMASIIAALASATRVVGIVMLPILVLEFFLQKRKNVLELLLPIFVSPLGLIYYMDFLLKRTGDPLVFFHTVTIFGEQRSSTLILLPQVLYRYIFKIIPFVNYSYFPVVFTTFLEFGVATIFIVLIVIGLFKIRLSYSLYAALTFIIPSLAGSFSSMPRYALVVFPVFLLFGLFINKAPKFYKYIFFSGMLILMGVTAAFFWRGYWIS